MKKQAIRLNKNYIVVESWMTQYLGLSGNELLVYAIIYGFSQVKNQICSCGDEYFASWLNLETRSIIRIKNKLKAQGLIEQIDNITVSGDRLQQDNRRVGYRAIVPEIGDKMSCNIAEIGDKMSCNSEEKGDKMSPNLPEIGDKMSCNIEKYVTKCHEIRDKMSRASFDNKKYNNNLNNNKNNACARACAREAVGSIRIVSESDSLTSFPTDEDEAIDTWLKISDKLREEVNSLGFDVWLEPIIPLGFCDDNLVLMAPTEAHRDEVTRRYLPIINTCATEIQQGANS